MPERWVRACRRLVPEPWRSSSYDPTIADLQRDWLVGRRPGSPFGRLAEPWRRRIAIAVVALECRRLAARMTLARFVHIPESRSAMAWSTVSRACRVFVRQPALSTVVVLTLAIGIGANLTVFGIVNQFLFAPLPVPQPDRLVRVGGVVPDRDFDVVSFPDYRDLRNGSPSFDLAAHTQPTARVGDLDTGEIRTVELVTGNFFRVLGLQPLRGRLIEDRDDDVEGAHAVVVIGAAYWRSHYGASEQVIGQKVLINSTPFEIVGIAPERFHGTYNARQVDLWAPLTMHGQVRPRGRSYETRSWGWLSMIGRLQDDATMATARRDADRVAADLARRFPPASTGAASRSRFDVRVASPLADADGRLFRPALAAAFAFTVLLMMVTCANLAGVLQARLVGRRRELAIRRSLGAGRGRLMAEWLAECMVLAVAGGLAGLVTSQLIGSWLASVKLPVELLGDLTVSTRLDWRVFGYATGLSLVAGLLFGIIPSLQAGSATPMTVLKDEGVSVISGRRNTRMRRAMVLVQVALSVMLLVASGLLTASLANRRTFSPGFETGHLALLQFDLRRQGVSEPEFPTFFDRILERVRQQPSVLHADVASTLPLAPGQDRMGVSIPGYVSPTGRTIVSLDFNMVGPDYFNALGVPFVTGGAWAPGTGASSIVVNETMARRFWPGGEAVGKTIKVIGSRDVIVSGVVRDTAYYDVGEAPRPFLFVPAESESRGSYFVLVRTASDPTDMVASIARATGGIDPRIAPWLKTTFETARDVTLFPMRMLAAASIAFGGISILLTAVGLYGVVSTMVGQRTKEIGVKIALGAQASRVVRGVLKDALVVTGAGAAIGFVGSYSLAGQLHSWLFGVGRFDLGVYLAVTVVTLVLALVAASLPARRAAKVDPAIALRT